MRNRLESTYPGDGDRHPEDESGNPHERSTNVRIHFGKHPCAVVAFPHASKGTRCALIEFGTEGAEWHETSAKTESNTRLRDDSRSLSRIQARQLPLQLFQPLDVLSNFGSIVLVKLQNLRSSLMRG